MNENPESRIQNPESLRGFWALIVTQFQGAFSDNALKNLVIFLIIGMNLPPEKRDALIPVVGALFALPFILFSMAGGFLADRFSKRSVTIGVKVFEIAVMGFALVALISDRLSLKLAGVFLMGVHSAIFGPSKYGLLPDLLPAKKLSWGNGVLELGTFVAIITGTMAGGFFSDHFRGHHEWSGAILIALAVCGLFTSLGITRVPAADPEKKFQPNFLADLFRQVQIIRRDHVLWLATLGNTYFFFLAALLQFNIIIYGKDVLHLPDAQNSYLQAAIAIGIGIGSFAAGYLSGGKIEYGLIPLGSAGLTVFAVALGWPGLSFLTFAVLLALLGFFGGFFIVPIAALLQHRPDKEKRGGVLAAANLLSFVGIFLASGAYYLMATVAHLSPSQIFLASAALTFAGTIYVVILLPDALLRFGLWAITNTLYRIRVDGRENIPAKGGALFVCNHVSWMDAILLLASTDRRVRFVMFEDIYKNKWLNPFCKILGVIPVSSYQRPRELIKSLQAASAAIRAGEVVCIFAEGEISRIGQLLPFRRGFERIMKDVDAPIIPIALDGVLGSPSSFKHGSFVWRLPSRIPHPVTVSYGSPLPATANAFTVRQAVQELLADSWHYRHDRMETLQRQFVRTARRHPRRFAMADAQNAEVNFGTALVRTIFLARRLKKIWNDQNMVGLLLPPSVPGALVNYAALLCGKVPVNLNYTLSAESLASCAKQCDIKTVLTSRAFLEKVKLTVPGEVIYLEDVAANPGALEKFAAFFMAKFFPVSLIECALGNCRRRREESLTESATKNNNETPNVVSYKAKNKLDSLATVIFSSGSTGEPKGVMLSHYNIVSNAEQLEQVFGLGKSDRLLGVLPFFHSFGFTGTLAMPAAVGVGVAFHANPLDTKTIGPLVRTHAVTFLLATPTFLQLYLRGCSPGDLGSVRFVMTGAEKLPERVATAFEEKFGIRPLEGYGCTECSPAVTVNTNDFRAAGFRQVGAKRGTIGHPLPGVCVRIVDVNNPRSEISLPLGEAGMLLVRGPNVMTGYLGRPEKTAEVLHHGWYVTGDVALVDEDGFVQITDRLSRFSKIGGEMVPHIKIEEKLHELTGVTEQTFVVTGVPDEKKGERIVVLHKLSDAALAECLEKFAACDLPNLWKPKAESFFRVENFPLLGTGKLDLRGVKEIAAKLAG
jgi:acyl-[acyl-carrier-protein]-phospholipid O-acyltransferase / long-chain-fatty-acid--[acyl-carrier-protein] ligase